MPYTPYAPEPLEALQARYAAALEVVFDATAIIEGRADRPGMFRANVFDFEDGLRLLISRERMPGSALLVLHVSASFRPECRIADEMRLLSLTMSRAACMEKWNRDNPRRFRELSGDKRDLEFAGWSTGLMPHWFLSLD